MKGKMLNNVRKGEGGKRRTVKGWRKEDARLQERVTKMGKSKKKGRREDLRRRKGKGRDVKGRGRMEKREETEIQGKKEAERNQNM